MPINAQVYGRYGTIDFSGGPTSWAWSSRPTVIDGDLPLVNENGVVNYNMAWDRRGGKFRRRFNPTMPRYGRR